MNVFFENNLRTSLLKSKIEVIENCTMIRAFSAFRQIIRIKFLVFRIQSTIWLYNMSGRCFAGNHK